MISQCRACKHLVVYKLLNGIGIDELSCNYFSNRAEMDLYEYCNFFEKVDKQDYVESNLCCDNCECSSMCDLIDVTNVYDECDHYYDIKGNYCFMDNAIIEYEDDEDDFD